MSDQAIEVVEKVINHQLDRLFRKMDALEERHGPWFDMPSQHFQSHSRLSHQAAQLTLSRIRIVRGIRKTC